MFTDDSANGGTLLAHPSMFASFPTNLVLLLAKSFWVGMGFLLKLILG
jgi:hypothetical protein